MITRKRTIGLLLTACLLTVGIASVYAKGGNPFDELWDYLSNVNGRVIALETKITELEDLITEGPGLGKLIHDSGWLSIDQSENLKICTLDDTNVFVYMVGRNQGDEWRWELHQAFLGGDRNQVSESGELGAYWYVAGKEGDTLYVHRQLRDPFWEEVRVLVWQLPS